MRIQAGTAMSPPSRERVRWFEDVYRVRLPDAMWDLLAVGNGAVPIDNTFIQQGRERLLERFLALYDDPKAVGEMGVYDIGVVLSQVEDRLIEDGDLIGTDVVPFGALFGGDLVCLSYRNPKAVQPSVVVWDHERSERDAPCFEEVAGSLEEFLAALRPSADL